MPAKIETESSKSPIINRQGHLVRVIQVLLEIAEDVTAPRKDRLSAARQIAEIKRGMVKPIPKTKAKTNVLGD